MAANRYGRIYHSDHHFINLRFPSVDGRRRFAEQFELYHASHDHDGEAPRFEDTAASAIGNMEANRVHDAHSVSIDGYATYEIEAYHNPDRFNGYDNSRYRPPTCCVAPTISINRTFIDSSELTRHELSAIFMDMPEEDFQNLLKSVERDGFKDPIVRMIDAQVLDGWHRYRAAKELNLLRKLRFQQWKEKDEGDPAAFVLARNIERRHLNPGQRAQIVVSFNERYGHGGDRTQSKSPNGDLKPKTREELAKEAGVGERTIDRAVQVKNAGEEQAKRVIAGESSAGEIITEETLKSLYEQITPAISDWKKAREGVGYASKSMFIKAALRWEGLPANTETDVKVLKILLDLLTTTETDILEELIRKQLDGKSLWDDFAPEDETESQETEQPKQTAAEREANTELKRKKGIVKLLWDLRIKVAREYTGDADTELNLHVTLPELEKGFAKCEAHAYCADAFRSAMQRTSETSFNICLEKTLASDVSLDDLDREYKAMSTYGTDIFQWERQTWIQELIDKKRKKADAKKAEPEPEAAPDTEGLSNEFKRLFTLHSDFAPEVLDVKSLAEIHKMDERDVEEAAGNFQRELLALEHAARKHLEADADLSAEEIMNRVGVSDLEVVKTMLAKIQLDTDDEKRQQELKDRLRSELNSHWLEHYNWTDLDEQVFIEAYGVDAATLLKMQREIAAEHPDPDDMETLWDAFNKRFPKWKAKYADSGYKENDLIQGATEAELFDALRLYRDSDETGPVTAEEIKEVTELMQKQSYPFARRVREVLRNKQAEELSDIGRLFAENQLRIIRNTVLPLLERLGADDMPHFDKSRLSADIGNVFLEYENVPTEKEMIIALLDVVDSIIAEEIADGRFDTLDNEVLCPDDEADRQAMNSDLVTEVEE